MRKAAHSRIEIYIYSEAICDQYKAAADKAGLSLSKFFREAADQYIIRQAQDSVNTEEAYDIDDGEPLEFDEDGECVGDSTWDYPGSPYLDEDDDIY